MYATWSLICLSSLSPLSILTSSVTDSSRRNGGVTCMDSDMLSWGENKRMLSYSTFQALSKAVCNVRWIEIFKTTCIYIFFNMLFEEW